MPKLQIDHFDEHFEKYREPDNHRKRLPKRPHFVDHAFNENRNAFRILERDVTRVCEYFARQGVKSRPDRLAVELWLRYQYPLKPDVHPRLLGGDDPADRTFWSGLNE